jgi:predicted TIM-barrel fold metal-dependent hydrolase
MIDCHTHVGEQGVHLGGAFMDDARRAWGPDLQLGTTLEAHWAAMQAVDRAIVIAFAAPTVGFVVPNEYVSSYVSEHPDKLIGFASVDPNDADAPAELRSAVQRLGLKGLKLGPIYQRFDHLSDRACDVYAVAQELGLPVIWHQGTTFVRDAPLALARPMALDDVARLFPRLKIVIAHLGHPWIEEAMATIRKHPSLFADISALESRPWQYYNGIVAALEYGVSDKLLFGSDYPFSTPERSAAGLRSINSLVDGTNLPRVPDAVIDGILERDSLHVLGLDASIEQAL